MSRINRYVLKEILGPTLLGILVYGVVLVMNLLLWSGVYFVLSRFGLLSICACFFLLVILGQAPDLKLTTWYSGATISILFVMGAVLAYAFFTSLAGRSLFAESMVPEE